MTIEKFKEHYKLVFIWLHCKELQKIVITKNWLENHRD